MFKAIQKINFFRSIQLLSLMFIVSIGQAADSTATVVDSLPPVFRIGQNEYAYESLVSSCNNPLLTVCKDSMDIAYRIWMGMLSDMEVYAEKSDFDIRGIKVWLNVFWNPNGSIKHLVYLPKPTCRNMDFTELDQFFHKFVSQWAMMGQDPSCYSHYGSATFPTFAEIYLRER